MAPTMTQPHRALNAQLGPTQINQVLSPAPNVQRGRVPEEETPNALTALEEKQVKREDFAPPVQKVPMRKRQGRLSV